MAICAGEDNPCTSGPKAQDEIKKDMYMHYEGQRQTIEEYWTCQHIVAYVERTVLSASRDPIELVIIVTNMVFFLDANSLLFRVSLIIFNAQLLFTY